ncbi:hypothetical protein ACFQYP_53000 [Nonomuraea antimicrobica]
MDSLRQLATVVQDYMKFQCGSFPMGNPDSPLFTGYDLSKRIESTESVQITDDFLMSYVMNRAIGVGYGPEHNELFTRSNFDGTRDDSALYDLMQQFLGRPGIRGKVGRCIQLTGSHSGDGTIRLNPVIPPSTSQSTNTWRWDMLRTMIHEFLHHLSHPGFNAKAQKIGHGQIIDEGFVDMITAIVFRQLVGEITKKPDLTGRFLPLQGPILPPPTWQLKTQYGEAGQGADKITKVVGQDRAYAAFFLGSTQHAGLK